MLRYTGRVLRGTAIGALVISAYGVGVVSGVDTGGPPQAQQRSLIDEAAGRITDEAARPIGRRELERAAIEGMLRRLGDRWADYYTAREFDDVQGRLNGRYSGVGIWLSEAVPATERGAAAPAAQPAAPAAQPAVRVASVQPGSAADRGGVRAGDVIASVDGRQVAGWNVARVAGALRGRPSTGVDVGVRRGRTEHHLKLTRGGVWAGDVTIEQRPKSVQLIRLGAFTRGVGRQVREIVLRDPAQHRRGILLDLRGNPGGLLDEAVETTSAFLTSGPVVTYEKRGAAPQRLNVTAPGDGRTPLVVLVDAGTASSAEVVAGSLRDRDRAVIVGSRTFGKGSVQEPVKLADGSALELTVGRYRTPSGRNLDGVGIDPDVEVSADRPPRVAEQRAESVLRGLLATLPTKDRG